MQRQLAALLGSVILLAAAATGCGSENRAMLGTSVETSQTAEEISFTLIVTDAEGKETTFPLSSSKGTVGEALLDAGLIEGEDGAYGLYVTTVNGVTLDYQQDGKYWAFYINDQYAATGVDAAELVEGACYELRAMAAE